MIAESTPAARWPAGLEELYREQRLDLLRTAFLICGSGHVADDVVQEAVARVVGRWSDVEHGRAYLHAAVANGARDHLRRARRLREVADVELVAADPASADSVDLARALTALSHDQRAAVVLRYYQGWTDEQIGAALSARPATVRSWLRRARLHLRRALEVTDG